MIKRRCLIDVVAGRGEQRKMAGQGESKYCQNANPEVGCTFRKSHYVVCTLLVCR